MLLIGSCLRQARFACPPLYRAVASSATRTIDIHATGQVRTEPKAEQPFRTSTNDPVRAELSLADESSRFF